MKFKIGDSVIYNQCPKGGSERRDFKIVKIVGVLKNHAFTYIIRFEDARLGHDIRHFLEHENSKNYTFEIIEKLKFGGLPYDPEMRSWLANENELSYLPNTYTFLKEEI